MISMIVVAGPMNLGLSGSNSGLAIFACFSPLFARSSVKSLILFGFVPSIQNTVSLDMFVERPSHILVILIRTASRTCESWFLSLL